MKAIAPSRSHVHSPAVMQDGDALDLCNPRVKEPPAKRRRCAVPLQYVDLTTEEPHRGRSAVRDGEEGGLTGTGAGSRGAATAAGQQRRGGAAGSGGAAATAPHPACACSSGVDSTRLNQRQPRQPRRSVRASAEDEVAEDWLVAKQLQEEEDRRAAATVQAESRMQRRFRELEAAEAAADAEEAADSAERRWGGRGFLGSLFGGTGSAAAAAAAGGPLGGQGPPRTGGRGLRSQRSRRGPAAASEYASAMMGHLVQPPYHYGRAGDYLGNVQALQDMMMGLSHGLPADLLFSGRDFTDADYEQLLALDAGVKKRTAPQERVSQLETVRVPLSGRGAAAAAAAAGSAGNGGSSLPLELDTCAICLEDACPGDKFKVLPCRHSFHCRCIDRWLLQERNSCPICQREVV